MLLLLSLSLLQSCGAADSPILHILLRMLTSSYSRCLKEFFRTMTRILSCTSTRPGTCCTAVA